MADGGVAFGEAAGVSELGVAGEMARMMLFALDPTIFMVGLVPSTHRAAQAGRVLLELPAFRVA